MGGLFAKLRGKKGGDKGSGGGPKRAAPPPKEQAELNLKRQRVKVIKFQRQVENEAKTYTEKARALLQKGMKDRALFCLKIKKYKEKQATQLNDQILTLTELVDRIEFESQQAEVIKGIEEGNAILKKMHEEMKVEDVERIMGDAAEYARYQDELSAAIAGEVLDSDEALLKEYAAIEEELADEASLELPAAPTDPVAVPDSGVVADPGAALDLPDAPTGPVEVPEEKHEERVAVPA